MRVIISGAGIAGPTLAFFLAKAGAQVTIVEKSKALFPHGQNVDIQGSALTVIKRMGLMDQVRRCNTTETGTQFIGPNGRPIASFPLNGKTEVSFTSDFEILRGDLAAILYAHTRDNPNVKYMFDTTIKNVISNDEEMVKVELDNGKEQEYDLLVAADGQWSKVRKHCFSSDSIKVIDKDMYAVYFTVPRLPDDNSFWNIYLALRSRIVAVRPDPHGTVRAMFTLMPCNKIQRKEWQKASRSDRTVQSELLRKDFSDAGWQSQRFLNAMDQAPDFYFQAIQQIKMSKWSSNRIICLGDAAFAPSPITGMGTSLAITGAYVLAGELSKLQQGQHPFVAFDAYEKVFRSFVEEQQHIPSFVPAVMHPETAGKRWLLYAFAWTMSKIISVYLALPSFSSTQKIKSSHQNDFVLPHYSSFEADWSVDSSIKER